MRRSKSLAPGLFRGSAVSSSVTIHHKRVHAVETGCERHYAIAHIGINYLEWLSFMTESSPWPTEVRLNTDKDQLIVAFGDDASYSLSAEYLRVFSPSAEVQGHSPDQRQTVPGKKDVRIAAVEAVGNYAIRIRFDDGHDTGLYSWSFLHDLGRSHDDHWSSYLRELAEKGLSRA